MYMHKERKDDKRQSNQIYEYGLNMDKIWIV